MKLWTQTNNNKTGMVPSTIITSIFISPVSKIGHGSCNKLLISNFGQSPRILLKSSTDLKNHYFILSYFDSFPVVCIIPVYEKVL